MIVLKYFIFLSILIICDETIILEIADSCYTV